MSISIQSLPPEILNRIFYFIAEEDDEYYGRPEVQDVLEVTARVCKRFNAVATGVLYEDIALRSLDSLILLMETFVHYNPSRAKLVKRFRYWNSDDNEPTPLLRQRLLSCEFPAMQVMDLEPGFTRFLSVLPAIPAMETLKSLSISGQTLPMLNGMSFPHLKELSLRDFYEASHTHHPSFPSLRSLSLDRVVGNSTVCNWLKHAVPEIYSLSARFSGLLPGSSVIREWPKLVRSLPDTLEEAVFDIGNMHPEIELFEHCLRHLEHLRKLKIHSIKKSLDLLYHLPQSIEIVELDFKTISEVDLFMCFRALQGASRLPDLLAIPSFYVRYMQPRPPSNINMQDECRKAYASLVQRGLPDIWSTHPSSLWNLESHIWKVPQAAVEEAPVESDVEDEPQPDSD